MSYRFSGEMPACVRLWLRDIRWTPEVEHITLQAKPIRCSLPPDLGGDDKDTENGPSSVKNMPNKAEKFEYIYCQMERYVNLINSILHQLEKPTPVDNNNETGSNHCSLTDFHNNLTVELSIQLVKMCDDFQVRCRYLSGQYDETTWTDAQKIQLNLRQQATILNLESTALGVKGDNEHFSKRLPTVLITTISRLYRHFVDQIILMDCKMLINILTLSGDATSFTRIAIAINNFAGRGNNLRRMFCQTNAITLLLNANHPFAITESMRVFSLRCLANIFSHPDSITNLEKDGNFNKLITLLLTYANTDIIRCEAAGVLAQVAVHLLPINTRKSYPTLRHELINAFPAIIRALLQMSKTAKDEETMLVVSACMANLSFLNSETPVLELLCQHDCMSSLLRCWRNGLVESLFTKNQILGVILSLSVRKFSQDKLLQQESLAEFFISTLHQCVPKTMLDQSDNILRIRNRVLHRCLRILDGLLKQEHFRILFLKSQGIRIYQEALKNVQQEENRLQMIK